LHEEWVIAVYIYQYGSSSVRLGDTLELILFLKQWLIERRKDKVKPNTLIAYEFDDPLAALINSSAKHSAMDLTLRKAESRVCAADVYVRRCHVSQIVTYTNGKEGNGLIHPSEGRDIDGLTSDGTLRSNSCGIFTWAGVDDCINKDLIRTREGECV